MPIHDMSSHAAMHAAQLREFYDAYVTAGFSPDEAFALTETLLEGMANSGSAE